MPLRWAGAPPRDRGDRRRASPPDRSAPSHLGAGGRARHGGASCSSREARPSGSVRGRCVAGRRRRRADRAPPRRRAGRAAGRSTSRPTGDGPWTLVVEAIGSPRDGQQTATLGTPPGRRAGVHGRGDAAALSGRRPGDRVVVDGHDPAAARLAVRRVPRADRRRRDADVADARASSRRPTTPADASRRCDAARPRRLTRVLPEPEAGLAAGILIGLRDRVDRDLAAAFTTAGVSHVVAISGWNIAIVAAAIAAVAGRSGPSPPVGRDDRRDRRVRRVRRRIGLGRPRGADGRRRPARARERPRRARATPPSAGPRRSCCSSRPGLIGDAGFQLSSLATAGLIAWATPLTEWLERVGRGRLPALAGREPRRLARGAGGDAADRPRLVRPAGDPVAGRQPRRRAARRAGDGRRASWPWRAVRSSLAGAPPVIGAVLAAPAG